MFAKSRRWKVALAAVALLATACARGPAVQGTGAPRAGIRSLALAGTGFPKGFMWGVATAGYQVEGGDDTSNWSIWERTGRAPQRVGKATDHWNRYPEDLGLAQGLGLNSIRLSLEWARIEPRPGEYDPVAVQHYHDVLRAARAKGLEPIVTLSHFAYPAWLDAMAPEGGSAWETEAMIDQFKRFAAFAALEYGKDVRWWLTLNEPNTLAACGYLAGLHPPGKRNPFAYAQVMDVQVRAHKEAYKIIHELDADAMVSINPIVVDYRPDNPPYKAPPGTIGIKAAFYLDETSFLDRICPPSQGLVPAPAGERFVDYMAFNYFYAPQVLDLVKLNSYLEWPIYPAGLYRASKRLHERYRLPLMVAENGLATDAKRPRPDGWNREAFLVNHVAHLQKAVDEGVPVLGYMHWTLTDNYEWGSWDPRFGLFSLDAADPALKRVRTPSADIYEAIARDNRVPERLLARYLDHRN